MKLDQLRYFVKVVECHSFNQAARELYMTQPALTKSIHQLEEELHVILLHRTKTGTYPTEYGLRVYNDCKDILDSLEEKIASWQTFHQDKERIAGAVHLAAIPVLCNLVIEKIIEGITQTYPQIEISLHDIPMDTFPDELLRGRFNIGITSVMHSQNEEYKKRCQSLHYHTERLLEDEYGIYLSTHHPLAKKPFLTKQDINHLKLITYSSNQPITFNDVFSYFGKVQYLNSIGNILQMVADNKGATVLMERAMMNNWYVANNLICMKKVKGETIRPCNHVLLWAEQPILTAAEQAVVEYIQTHYVQLYSEA